MSDWIYFGCYKEPGHYAFSEGMRPLVRRYGSKDVSRFDGVLPPQMDTAPYIATVSRLEGWDMTALAFWDYSVDKRGGCNSIVFAPSLTITPNELLAEAQTRFPQVFGRLPEPVRLLVPQPEPSAGWVFDKTTATLLLAAASKSGDPGAIALAAQLAGAAPCPNCGYVNFACRCTLPEPLTSWVEP